MRFYARFTRSGISQFNNNDRPHYIVIALVETSKFINVTVNFYNDILHLETQLYDSCSIAKSILERSTFFDPKSSYSGQVRNFHRNDRKKA